MSFPKQAISVRVGENDLYNLRQLAQRLGVRDSDVIRVAIKILLNKLSPLHDLSVTGKSLVPVFLENGSDLFRYFELDAARLFSLINDNATEDSKLDMEDVQLLAMSGIQKSYLRWKLERNTGSSKGGQAKVPSASDGQSSLEGDDSDLENALRHHFYAKYVSDNK